MESEQMHIRIKAVLEIIGKPKEYIEQKMKDYVQKIKQDEQLMLIEDKISDAKQQEKVWSVFGEIELVIKGVPNLVAFCIDYMPASIEVIKPEKFEFEDRIFTGVVNDILSKLHETDMISKTVATENKFLKRNMNGLIRNTLLILVKFGINDLEKISKATGIEQNEIRLFIDKLVEENRIKEDNGIYSIA
jgi:hypothetical protein